MNACWPKNKAARASMVSWSSLSLKAPSYPQNYEVAGLDSRFGFDKH
jgi:hypothetical protein